MIDFTMPVPMVDPYATFMTVLWVSALYAVFSLFRFSINIGLVERPLFIGFIWAIFTGDWITSLGIASFFELLWLDLIPAGTFIPPHHTAATFGALFLCSIFEFNDPVHCFLAILLAIPLAYLGAKLDMVFRKFHNRSFHTLMRQAKDNPVDFKAGGFVLRSIILQGVIGFLFCLFALVFLTFVAHIVIPVWDGLTTHLTLSWGVIWFGATIGGLLALRWKRAYAVLVFGVVLAGVGVAFFS